MTQKIVFLFNSSIYYTKVVFLYCKIFFICQFFLYVRVLLNQYRITEDGTGSHSAVFGTVACCSLATHTGPNVRTATDIWDMAWPGYGRGWSLASSLPPLCTIHVQFSDKTWSPRRSAGYSSSPDIWLTVSTSEKQNMCWICLWERKKALDYLIEGGKEVFSDVRSNVV
jgi:hypothetical protein